MINAPTFASLEDMESSKWLANIKTVMMQDQWPAECVRCQETTPHSVKDYANALDERTSQRDYLQVGGVLDNLCNAACLTCNEHLSTRIGSLKSRTFDIVDNSQQFYQLPQQRIVHLDINGGEPAYSKNYKKLLQQLPPNLKTLRLNTNGSIVLRELEVIAGQGIEVTVTVSCDGIGPVHELIRWPLLWQEFYDNLMVYKSMPVRLNLWTTVSLLNSQDLPNIIAFAREHGIDHSYAYLKHPHELSVTNPDSSQSEAYIIDQKRLRNIEI